PASGFVAAADAEYIGRACLLLGAGRAQITDTVDPAVGVADLVKIGEPVEQGQPLAVLHANDERKLAAARTLLESAFRITPAPAPVPPLILEEITA
ncbi:MAG: pyrimidine-nucleoside phosphorylase, partial [Kiritimatiellaeota bacterium]|nr:pyrimidine-nucleoside phosphorylase [Kiritimatiellota bacterium]